MTGSTLTLAALSYTLLTLAPAARTGDTSIKTQKSRDAFIVDQRSYWLSEGIDPTAVAAVDTVLSVVPDTSSSDHQPWGFRYSFEPSRVMERGWGDGSLSSQDPGQLRDLQFKPSRTPSGDFSPALTTTLAQLPEWLSQLPTSTSTSWTDTLSWAVSLGRDTIQITRVRSFHRAGTTPTGLRVLVDDGTLRLRSSTLSDIELQDASRIHADLNGRVVDTVAYDSVTGLTDSLRSHAALSGTLVFLAPGSSPDTIRGIWYAERGGAWGLDPRALAGARMTYFMVHGRDSGTARGAAASHAGLAERVALGDSTILDSLLRARVDAPSAYARALVDSAMVFSGVADTQAQHFLRVGAEAYRPGNGHLLLELVWAWKYREQAPMDVEFARVLANQFRSLHAERAALVDRQEIFAQIIAALGDRRGREVVSPAAAALLADAAKRTDDHQARDLFLLAAYEGDPYRYLPLLERLADSLSGFGPIARAYAQGNGEMVNWSYGLTPGQKLDGMPFPGVEAPWVELARYLNPHQDPMAPVERTWSGFGNRDWGPDAPRPLTSWLTAHRVDGPRAFRQRFLADTNERARLTWAAYLFLWRDTLPLPWVRQVASQDGDDVAKRAWNLLVEHVSLAEDVTDASTITDIQEALLKDALGDEPLPDTTGVSPRRMRPHDERPEQRLLLRDNLSDSKVAHWGSTFTILSRDSVKALAKGQGLQMAWEVTTIRKYQDQYQVGISLLPHGQPCLCGGGSTFILERRHGRWVALSAMSWVS